MGVSVGSSIYNAPSIYESGAGGGGGGGGEGLPVGEIVEFPTGYTPLEKIEFDGKSEERISISLDGYRLPNNTTENTVELTAKVTDIHKVCTFIKYLPAIPNDSLGFNGGFYCQVFSNSSSNNCFVNHQNLFEQKFSIRYKYNKVSLNELVENQPWFTVINTKDHVNIGSYSGSADSGSTYMEIYAFKIYDPNGNMIFFGVPAFDEANQIDGLLDIITNEFFAHEWKT